MRQIHKATNLKYFYESKISKMKWKLPLRHATLFRSVHVYR